MNGNGRSTTALIFVSCLAICHSFNIHCIPSQQPRLRLRDRSGSIRHTGHIIKVDVCLNLFGSILPNKSHASTTQPYTRCIPDSDLVFMREGFGLHNLSIVPPPPPPPPFPYVIHLGSSLSSTPKRDGSLDSRMNNGTSHVEKLIIRHLEEEDILRIMPEIVREFGSLLTTQPQLPFTSSSVLTENKSAQDEVVNQIENFLFSFTVLLGLTQRVARRKKGYLTTNYNFCPPDHNVICLVEQHVQMPSAETMFSMDNGSDSYIKEEIVGIAELSWQPPIPNRNAPPYVIPFFIKNLLSRFFSSSPRSRSNHNIYSTFGTTGYISNVLVWKNRRGRGYSHVLMAAVEGVAKLWGCADVRLHVDANERTGSVAQQLYKSLGYVGVPDRGITKTDRVGYEWMGPNNSMVHEGLYIVDGLPLLYLRKDII